MSTVEGVMPDSIQMKNTSEHDERVGEPMSWLPQTSQLSLGRDRPSRLATSISADRGDLGYAISNFEMPRGRHPCSIA